MSRECDDCPGGKSWEDEAERRQARIEELTAALHRIELKVGGLPTEALLGDIDAIVIQALNPSMRGERD